MNDEDRKLILKFTRKVTALEGRVDVLEKQTIKAPPPEQKVELKNVEPKVDGSPEPHCVITSTFDLEGIVDPVNLVVSQNAAQMEIRQHVIDFCRKHKIIGMSINFTEKK